MADDSTIDEFRRRMALDIIRRGPALDLKPLDAASGEIRTEPRPQSTLEAWLGGIKNLATETVKPIGRFGSALLGKTTLDSYPTETLSGKGTKGGGAFNYVVFDDRDVRLVSRESGGVVDDLINERVTQNQMIDDRIQQNKKGRF